MVNLEDIVVDYVTTALSLANRTIENSSKYNGIGNVMEFINMARNFCMYAGRNYRNNQIDDLANKIVDDSINIVTFAAKNKQNYSLSGNASRFFHIMFVANMGYSVYYHFHYNAPISDSLLIVGIAGASKFISYLFKIADVRKNVGLMVPELLLFKDRLTPQIISRAMYSRYDEIAMLIPKT